HVLGRLVLGRRLAFLRGPAADVAEARAGRAAAQGTRDAVTNLVGETAAQMIVVAERGALAPHVQERRLDDAGRERFGFAQLLLGARQTLGKLSVERALERGFVGEISGGRERAGGSGTG